MRAELTLGVDTTSPDVDHVVAKILDAIESVETVVSADVLAFEVK
jgi:hypothetical protein